MKSTLISLLSVVAALAAAGEPVAVDLRLHEALQSRLRGMSQMPAYVDGIRSALQAGADPNREVNGKTAMDVAERISWDMQQAYARYELTLAGAKADAEQAQSMLLFGACYGYPDFIERALACGASPNGMADGATYTFVDGETYLFTALDGFECHYDGNKTESVRALLAGGADPNIPNRKDGLVPLLCWWCTPEQMELLLRHGADVNVTDAEGRNVLMRKLKHAFPLKCEKMIRLLVSAGLSLNHKDNSGLSVMDYALRIQKRNRGLKHVSPETLKTDAAMIELLRSLGAE